MNLVPRRRRGAALRAAPADRRRARRRPAASRSPWRLPQTPWGILRATSMGVGARAWGPVTYLGVGRSSTVLVTDQRGCLVAAHEWPARGGDAEEQTPRPGTRVTHWLTALPILARPEARSLLLVGFGGGMAIEVVPPSIERIDVVELEPEVIAANRLVAKGRWRDPLSDPRVHVHLNDARNALSLARVALRRDRLAAVASVGGRRGPSLYPRVLRARAAAGSPRTERSCSGSASRSSTRRCSGRCSRRCATCSPTCACTRRRPTARSCSSRPPRRSTWSAASRARSPRIRARSASSASTFPRT